MDTARLQCTQLDHLPRLAWCASLDPRAQRVQVLHGPAVETGADFFVEGAWNGPYQDPAFAEALVFMGSGGRVTSDGLLISTASHTLEPLYQMRIDGVLYFSNSLSLLLARTGQRLNPRNPEYLAVLSSMRYGTARYTRQIPTLAGPAVEMLLYCTIRVDWHGRTTQLARPEPDDFADYRSYKEFLIRELGLLWDNARAPERKIRYGMITPTSSGYDSPACAALAHELGSDEIFTFHTTAGGDDDSGAPVARHLGMKCHEFAREDGYHNQQAIIEFVACCDAELHFAACEEILRDKICISGFLADTTWGKSLKVPFGMQRNETLERSGFAGISLCEFRLRVGFIHLPLPMIGMSRDTSLWKITHSEEMAPWRLGRSYDRPIPRRIAEEAGVPREAFGQKKKVTLTIFSPKSSAFRGSALVADYQKFLADNQCRTQFRFSPHNALAWLVGKFRFAAHVADHYGWLPVSWRMPTYGAPWVPIRYMYRLSEQSYLIPWAVDKLRAQYDATLAEAPTTQSSHP